ncbi:UDP-N-acetylmuramate dehydrogenase [Candidatus Daviesbacteria bacterium]|nr:UDP-N-acetylmuramate dehydrogenase [Candidatus Daviesbacteria bacterium]
MDLPNLKKDILFSSLTTLKIGGPIKYFLEVNSEQELTEAVKWAKEKNIPFLIIGSGSNLLVSDQGFKGLVIKNTISGISDQRSEQSFSPTQTSAGGQKRLRATHLVKAQTGTDLQELVNYTISQGLGGLERLTGVPGTVGGAIFGNAGAYGQTISDFLGQVSCLDPETLKTISLSKKECQFGYRASGFRKNKLIILEVTFELIKADQNQLKKEAKEVLEKRIKKYKPGVLCPGSFFKNILMKNIPKQTKKLIPKERDYFGKVPAWFFLDEVGAKGDRLGQIEIADFHGNLFINLGKGGASDFYNLAKKYYQKVKEKFGIELEPEVQLINLPTIK